MTDDEIRELIKPIVSSAETDQSALMPVLHGVQESFGFIPATVVPVVAKALGLSRAEVHGVVSFYHYFRTQAPGRTHIEVCRAESCQAMGSHQLEAHIKQRLGIDYHQTSTDGEHSLEPVYCLGNCACSPNIMVNDQVYARVTPASFDQLVLEK